MALKSVLITGCNGNLGHLLANHFENVGIHVISYDIDEPQRPVDSQNIIIDEFCDLEKLHSLFKKCPNTVVHLAGLLSGSSEVDPIASWEINATASVNLMQIADQYGVNPFVFSSTVASYGPEVPAELPAETPQWPQTFMVRQKSQLTYGFWIKTKRDFEFRCLRFPIIISPFPPPGAVTAYPGNACLAAKSGKAFHISRKSRDRHVNTLPDECRAQFGGIYFVR